MRNVVILDFHWKTYKHKPSATRIYDDYDDDYYYSYECSVCAPVPCYFFFTSANLFVSLPLSVSLIRFDCL